MKPRILSLFLLVLLAVALSAQEQSPDLLVTADQVSYSAGEAQALAQGNVTVTYGDARLSCQRARINRETGDYSAEGDVEVTYGDIGTWHGASAKGNFMEKTLAFGPFRMDGKVLHGGGESGTGKIDSQEVSHGWFSTCDLEEPHYSVNASTFRFYPENKTFSATNATIRFFGIPVLYLPYLFGSTDNSSGIIVQPGYSGKLGAFLRLGVAIQHGGKGTSKIFVDGMTKRGFGFGEQTQYKSDGREVQSDLYGVHDWDPTETEKGWDRRFRTTKNRYRIHIYWREVLAEGLTLRANLDRLSDISMLEDWFKRDWRRTGQPKSVASLDYDLGWLDAAIDLRPRINDFYTVAERLSEMRLNIPRVAVGGSALLYNSSTTAGYYSMKWRDSERPRLIDPLHYDSDIHGDPSDYSAFRADTLHTLSMPLDVQEYLTLTPRASFRMTTYSKSSSSRMTTEDLADLADADNPDKPRNRAPVRSYDSKGGALFRIASEFGIEARSHLSSDWSDTRIPLLSVDGLRHLVEPYVNYTYAPEPTKDRDNIYFFDEIDRLERQHFVRFGLDQRWLTRGEGEKAPDHRFLSLDSYLDLHMQRGKESDSCWGDLGNRLILQPTDSFRTWGTLLYDTGVGAVHRGEIGARLGKEDELSFSGRYIYRNDHLTRSVYSMGSSLADLTGESGYIKKHFEHADIFAGTLNIPIIDGMSLEIYNEYDLERHCIAEHSYQLTKRLHCWTVVACVGWDYGDFRAGLLFRLTAFPDVRIDMNI